MRKKTLSTLSDLSICAYSFSRVYRTGKRLEIWSNEKALEESMLEKRYLSDIYTPDLYVGDFNKKSFYIPSHLSSLTQKYRVKYEQQLHHLQDNFGYSRPLNIVNKQSHYTDYHLFYVSNKMPSAVNFYLSNQCDLINLSSMVECDMQSDIEEGNVYIINPKPQPSKFDITHKEALTPCEFGLLADIAKGYLYKNNTVGLSADSAKVYVHRIKNKLALKTKSELISYYTRNIIS